MKPWTAKSIASKRTENALIWTGTARNMNWNRKERAVVDASTEIVLANGATGRQIGCGCQVWPIGPTSTSTRLLNAGINSERRSGHKRGHIEQLPAPGNLLTHRFQQIETIEWKRLDQA